MMMLHSSHTILFTSV